MAQWLGQFSGDTHATRVEDAEAALHHTVVVFRAASSDEDRKRKAKSVRNLASRLLSARLKLLKARVAALKPVAENAKGQSCGIESLQQREAKMRAEGLNGIFIEFGVPNSMV
jgi:hypothetical protein